jgi:shikimate dehydrogenase
MRELVTGHPQVFYGLLGSPVRHVRSPGLITARLAERGLPGKVVALDISAANLAQALAGFRLVDNLAGFLVTMPHKEAIAELVDSLTPEAAAAGAVNIVRRNSDGTLSGGQLDGAGFVAAMKNGGTDPAGQLIHIAGAGGVSAGIAAALAAAGAGRIVIANRSPARAQVLVTRLAAAYPAVEFGVGENVAADAQILINATSLGLNADDPLPFPEHTLLPGRFVGDVVNIATQTPILKLAAERGCRIQAGQAMVEPQLDLMLDFFGQDTTP